MENFIIIDYSKSKDFEQRSTNADQFHDEFEVSISKELYESEKNKEQFKKGILFQMTNH